MSDEATLLAELDVALADLADAENAVAEIRDALDELGSDHD